MFGFIFNLQLKRDLSMIFCHENHATLLHCYQSKKLVEIHV